MSAATEMGGRESGWLDLRRRDIRDALTVLGLASTVLAGTAAFAALKFFGALGGDDRFQLAVVTVLLLTCCIIAVTFGRRRLQDLRTEILARRQAEEKITALAMRDALTDLPNRQLFIERVEAALRRAGEEGRLAVLMLDLDGFRSINDRYGHLCGNEVLIEFARRTTALVGSDDHVVARFGDDCFAVLMPQFRSREEPVRLARRLAGC